MGGAGGAPVGGHAVRAGRAPLGGALGGTGSPEAP